LAFAKLRNLILGYFGASTGTAAALIAAATITGPIKNQDQLQAEERPADELALGAIVSRSGRPDLAGVEDLKNINVPTLFIVGGNDFSQLLSEGNLSTKDIARIVGTTEAYVWKEKSKLKTSGLLISRDTEVISKTSQLNIYANNSLLSVPQLDAEGLKKLYSEFVIGKKPAEVIAEYGFHPELVENEYQRLLRFVESDIVVLQKKFFLYLKQDLLTANNNTINSLVEKFRKDGKLTIAEFITLIKSLLDERYQVGRLSAIRDLINGIIPDGWEADLCLNCNKPVNGVMMDAARTTRIMVSDRSRPLTHSPWGPKLLTMIEHIISK
jgi:biotin operon repressor